MTCQCKYTPGNERIVFEMDSLISFFFLAILVSIKSTVFEPFAAGMIFLFFKLQFKCEMYAKRISFCKSSQLL